MSESLKNLRNELLKKMEENNWNITQLSIICDISYHGMCNIVNGTSKDINLATFEKICKNAGISYADVFQIKDLEMFNKMIKDFFLTDGSLTFHIK